jgi:hypothetical protein
MIEVNDRVKLSEEAITILANAFWGECLEEWGVDLKAFGEGTVADIVSSHNGWNDEKTAVIKWDTPQTLMFEDTDEGHDGIKVLDHVAVCWLEKVASDA